MEDYNEFKKPIDLGNMEDFYAGTDGTIKEFCMKDEQLKKEYEELGSEKTFEEVVDDFVKFIFDNSGNPRLQMYISHVDDEKGYTLMDLYDVVKLFKPFVNNDRSILDPIEEGNKAVKMYKASMQKNKKAQENPVDVKDADLVKYCFVYLSNDFIEKGGLTDGDIFVIKSGMLYSIDNDPLYVNGEVTLIYVGGERKQAVTKQFFDKVMEMKDK